MLVKVCGMREPDNVKQVAQLGVDMMGFIFYPKSRRYASHVVARYDAERQVCRVGDFVNDSISNTLDKIHSFSLNAVQMHGIESRELCEQLRAAKGNMKIIKAISVSTAGDIQEYKEYVGAVDYFLFDTKYKKEGGSGHQFDWQVQDKDEGDIPFLLSGGIGLEDASGILSFHHARCVGIDLNSRCEIEPGLKDVEKLKECLLKVKK